MRWSSSWNSWRSCRSGLPSSFSNIRRPIWSRHQFPLAPDDRDRGASARGGFPVVRRSIRGRSFVRGKLSGCGIVRGEFVRLFGGRGGLRRFFRLGCRFRLRFGFLPERRFDLGRDEAQLHKRHFHALLGEHVLDFREIMSFAGAVRDERFDFVMCHGSALSKRVRKKNPVKTIGGTAEKSRGVLRKKLKNAACPVFFSSSLPSNTPGLLIIVRIFLK